MNVDDAKPSRHSDELGRHQIMIFLSKLSLTPTLDTEWYSKHKNRKRSLKVMDTKGTGRKKTRRKLTLLTLDHFVEYHS